MSTAPVHVVFAGNFPYPNGYAGTKRVQHYVDYVSDRAPVSVLVLRGAPLVPGNEAAQGLHRAVPYQVVGKDLRAGAGAALAVPRMYAAAWRHLRARRPQGARGVLVYYGQPDIENFPLLLAARHLGYTCVNDIVEDSDLVGQAPHGGAALKLRTRRWLDRRITRIADGLIVISRHLEAKYAATGLPMVTIPVCARLGSAPKRANFHDPVSVIYAGTYGEKDGVAYVLEAVRLARARGVRVRLKLLGGSARQWARTAAGGKGEGVDVVGYLPDDAFYPYLLAEADILCMPRTSSPYARAGFPFKLAEYLATGNPVVATNVGDVGLYVEDRIHARLVPPDDVEALAGAIAELAADPTEAFAMGRRGRERCGTVFDPETNGEKLWQLIQRVAMGRRS